jgi:hypothetical protein
MRAVQATLALLLALVSCAPSARPSSGVAIAGAPIEGDPAWIVEQYFLRRTFPNKGSFLTGEVSNGPTVGSRLPADAVVTYRQIAASTEAAVFGVTLRHDGRMDDVYAYLASRNGAWRLEAIRALALPPIYFVLLDSLELANPLPDSLKPMLASMRLTVASDSALREHYQRNREAFHRLARGFLASGADLIRDDGRIRPATALAAGLPELLRELVVATAMRDTEHRGCLLLSVGGMGDNHIGYFYAPPGCTVPSMSPRDYILLDELESGWYLYKAT